ncbi:MAG: methyltransferase domain-containing protein [Rhodocyclaceae bacterium]|nr:methyltransferase domain-containing protein [Rhodocyclaceae bacterium]
MNGTQVDRACPVCLATGTDKVFENRMSPVGGFDMSYRVASCRGCGFVFANHLPPARRYSDYYRELSKYDTCADAAAISDTERLRASRVVAMCEPYIERTSAIADLGCGSGTLLGSFRAKGWERLHGLDPAPKAAAQARAMFGLSSIKSGLLADAARLLPLRQCRLICLTGVLEHLPRLREEMSSLMASIADGTLVLVEVPALERFRRKPFEPFGEFSLEHIQYFSARSLEQFFAGLGARRVEMELADLPQGTTDSIFGLFAKGGAPNPGREVSDDGAEIRAYVTESEALMSLVRERIANCRGPRIIVFGAGSHSARLLPLLEQWGIASRITAIVDRNPNLHGRCIGRWTVESVARIADDPEATLLVSTFRSQTEASLALAASFPNLQLLPYAAEEFRP